MSDHLNDHLTRALDAMAAADIDVVLLGREANARWVSGANRLWLAGTRPFAPGCVVVRETGAVHLLSITDDGVPPSIGHECLYPITWNPMKLLSAVAVIPGVHSARRVGVDGLGPLFEQLLAGVFPNAEIVDAEAVLRTLRQVKHPADVDAIRAAVEIAEAAFGVATDAIAPGVREVELKGAFEEAMAARGVTTPAFEGTFCVVDPGGPARALVTNRALADGDAIHVRAGVLRDGWEGSLARTWSCGASLDVTTARAALDTMIASCRSGTTVGELRAHTLGASVDGIGMGHEELGSAETLVPGFVLSIEVLVDDVLLGDMVLVTDGEPERLTTFPDSQGPSGPAQRRAGAGRRTPAGVDLGRGRAREPESALGDDRALDLTGPRLDRGDLRMTVRVLHPSACRGPGRAVTEHASGTERIEQARRGTDERLRREQLRHRALGDRELPRAIAAVMRKPSSRPDDQIGHGAGHPNPNGWAIEEAVDRWAALDDLAQQPIELPHHCRVALERERNRHHVPTAIDLAHPARVRDTHIRVEGDVRALTTERLDRLQLDPGCAHRHEEHRQASVLRH